MIKVKYSNKFIKISGHADFNDYGKDIVCASASSIVYTTINGILNININAIKYTDEKELVIEILSNDEITNKLIGSMLDLLKELEAQYPKNIKISKGE
ncbi:MAG: ribosomal-processing cysteine protease Prp [Firmicutes bacterium]|nr:ribosomal-processing cysteine protease Prp [Bacillota bacterium]